MMKWRIIDTDINNITNYMISLLLMLFYALWGLLILWKLSTVIVLNAAEFRQFLVFVFCISQGKSDMDFVANFVENTSK